MTPVVGSKRPASAMDPSTDSGDVTSVKLVGFQAELDRLQEKRRKIKMKHRTERAVYEDLERKVETEETALEQAKHALERAMAEKTEQRHKISQIHRGFAEIDVQTAELTKLKDAYEKYEKRARTQ
jgi:chromosome segregation ATPase